MTLTPGEAAQSLQDVSETQRRSRQAYGYSRSAPYFSTWGIIWMLGYGSQALRPDMAGWIWPGLVLCGIIASFALRRPATDSGNYAGWRFGAAFCVIALFTAGIFAVLHPSNALRIGAYWPLLFGAIYAAVGIWAGLRYVIVGAFITAATLIAYFFLRDYFFLWMALVGGGALFLTGFWLRQA